MAKPRIGIVHYSCPPIIGGVEFILQAHATQFAKAGYRTKVIVGRGGEFSPDVQVAVIPELTSRGGPLARLLRELAHGGVPKTFGAAVRRVEKKLSGALRDVDVCMIHNVMTMHFNLVLTSALARIMKRNKRIHFIAWTHDLTFGDPVYEPNQHRRYPWSLLQQAAPGCRYCAISRQRQMEMRRLFRVAAWQIPVIPDGIDVPAQLGLTRSVEQIFHDEHLSGVDVVALTPARILRRKNLGVGMEIVAALKKQGKSVRWIVTGAADPHNVDSMRYYRMLNAMRRRLRVAKEVIFLCDRFHDPVSDEDLRALYQISDMLLFPSEREGFGLPVLEAGLAGMLVVINDIPALREVAGGHGMYIRLGDSSDIIARNITGAMKKRPELLYRKQVISQYSWEVVFNRDILPAVLKPQAVWSPKTKGKRRGT